jgi:hypothetical protein
MLKICNALICLAFIVCSFELRGGNGSALRRQHLHEEQTDLIELNHFYDLRGVHIYDQVIFWERHPGSGRYQVRAWILVEDRESLNRRPIKDVASSRWSCTYFDTEALVLRRIHSPLFRESWTQIDPERENKKLLDERLRKLLILSNEAREGVMKKLDIEPVTEKLEKPE